MCEMDSHADTCCLDMNFVPIYFMGKVCEMAPFLSELSNQKESRFAWELLLLITPMVEHISMW